MDVINSFFTPISIAFFAIALGLCVGRIKILNISLDLAAVLIISVALGIFVSANDSMTNTEQINNYMPMFSSLGTALFVSVIGLNTGYSITSSCKGRLSSAAVGMLMVCSSFALMNIFMRFDFGMSSSNLYGVLCGALTTTPGLSAICEKADVIAEEASLGYGCAYLFGVVFTVLSVQIIMRKGQIERANIISNNNVYSEAMFGGLLQISLSIILGRALGAIKIPIVNISLGNSGGMLCAGIIIGYIVAKCIKSHSISSKHQESIRNIGLSLFFVGNGIPAGMKMIFGFNYMSMLLGAVLTLVPISVGVLACKLFLRKNNKETAAIISGGMTSTPAIGVLTSKGDVDYDKYSFAYVGALIAIIILCRS